LVVNISKRGRVTCKVGLRSITSIECPTVLLLVTDIETLLESQDCTYQYQHCDGTEFQCDTTLLLKNFRMSSCC